MLMQMELRPAAAASDWSQSAPAPGGRARVVRRGHRQARRASGRSARSGRLREPLAATVERLEGSLLNRVMDTHPNRSRALDRVLDDIFRAEGPHADLSRDACRAEAVHAPLSPASRRRIEKLLAAVVLTSCRC